MKKIKYLLGCVAVSVVAATMAACDNNSEGLFLKRDTDEMTFSYLNTTKELSVFSNGHWEVSTDDGWIELSPESGTGNGEDRQKVEVTVRHNKGDARQGTIYLSNSEKQLEISVSQDDGIFSWDNAKFSGKMLIGQASNSRILVSYFKAGDDDYADVSVTLHGAGSPGLSATPVNGYKLDPGDGAIVLIIEGTPTSSGEVIAVINADLTSRDVAGELSARDGYVKASEDDVEPLPSPTVTLFRNLPRLAVLDWGKYTRNSGDSRKFTLELAETQFGPAIRRYSAQADWLSSASIGTGSYFYENNRFAFGDLMPGTTYWFRIIRHTNNIAENVDSNMTYFEFTTPEEEPLGSDVLLYKDFDNFWWGGCPIYQAFAVMPTETQIKANLDPASDIVKATDYRTYYPVGNIATPFGASLGAANCPAMWKYYWDGDTYGYNISASGYAGWNGSNLFPCTGSVRMATASAVGWLRTPKLTSIGEGTANITVTVNTAPYFEAYHGWGEDFLQHYIIVSGGGKITGGGPTLKDIELDGTQAIVECTSNVNPSTNGPSGTHAATTEHTVNITGATKDTQITIRTFPYSGSAHYRIWLDDIKVVKN